MRCPAAHAHQVEPSNSYLCQDTSGYLSAHALIKFSRHTNVPLLVLADNDNAGKRIVKILIKEGKLYRPEIVWMETQTADQSGAIKITNGAIERMLIEFDLELCRRVFQQFDLPANDKKEILNSMKDKKGNIGTFIAEEFLKVYPYSSTGSNWPEPLRELVDKLHYQLAEDNKEV